MNRIAVLAVSLTLASLPANAQPLFDQSSTKVQDQATPSAGPPSFSTNALVESTGGLSLAAIKALVEKQGYTKITDLMPSPWTGVLQASAVNTAGLPTNLQIDPTNGNVISALASH